MKCKKCGKFMVSDCENEKYVCECGYEIKWSTNSEREYDNTLYF